MSTAFRAVQPAPIALSISRATRPAHADRPTGVQFHFPFLSPSVCVCVFGQLDWRERKVKGIMIIWYKNAEKMFSLKYFCSFQILIWYTFLNFETNSYFVKYSSCQIKKKDEKF